MKPITELQRLASPAPKPQSLAWDGATLWMGSRATKNIYAIQPATWTVTNETAAPGTPWGMTAVGNELRVICGETAEDPDDTGSQLGFSQEKLHVSQWYPKKILTLAGDGKIERVIQLPRGICGQVWVDGLIYLVTTDAEETNEYWLTRVDPRPATPVIKDVALIPFQARALAWDGTKFWTNHREQNQIVAFL